MTSRRTALVVFSAAALGVVPAIRCGIAAYGAGRVLLVRQE